MKSYMGAWEWGCLYTLHVSTHLDSAIIAEACNSNWDWWSELYALAYATLSSTSAPDKPYLQIESDVLVCHQRLSSAFDLSNPNPNPNPTPNNANMDMQVSRYSNNKFCSSSNSKWPYTFQLPQEVSLGWKCPQYQCTSISLLRHHCQLATVKNSARVK